MKSTNKHNIEQIRYDVLVRLSKKYTWWLGYQSRYIHTGLKKIGWNLSRLGYRILGRPKGALTWPLGLAFLSLNATNHTVFKNSIWIANCFEKIIDEDGNKLLLNDGIDIGGIGYAALRMYEISGNSKYLNFSIALGQKYIKMHGFENGLISYSINRPEVLVDTIAFLCPFLARMTRLTGNVEYASVAIIQMETMWQKGQGLDPWIYHGFNKINMSLLGINNWGRGVGWLLIGIIDTVLELSPSAEREIWLIRAIALLRKLADLQLDSGHFPWRFDGSSSKIDSSVTSLVAYSIARLMQSNSSIGISLVDTLKRCRNAINTTTNKSGYVTHCSGEALGVGQYSQELGSFIWGQALAVATDSILENILF